MFMLSDHTSFFTVDFYAHHSHFLSSVLSESLRPLHFSGISLSVKVSVTFRSAKFESLCIVANKCYTMPWVNWTRAEIAITNSHFLIEDKSTAIMTISRVSCS